MAGHELHTFDQPDLVRKDFNKTKSAVRQRTGSAGHKKLLIRKDNLVVLLMGIQRCEKDRSRQQVIRGDICLN